MKGKIFTLLWFILSIFLVSFILTGKIHASELFRVELKDSTVYENVSVKSNKLYKVITIKEDDQERNISFADIAIISDSDGNDVTEQFLGSYYQPTIIVSEVSGDWKSETSVKYKKLRNLPFSIAFRFGSNYSFPLSDYYYGFTSGVGIGGDIIIPIVKNEALRITISKSGMKDDARKLIGYSGYSIIEDKLSLKVWRFFISAQYNVKSNKKSKNNSLYYLYAGIGAISHSFSGYLIVKDNQTEELLSTMPSTDTETKFAFTYGFGFVPMISDAVGIELGCTFDLVLVGTYGNAGNPFSGFQYAYLFDLKLGLITIIP